MILFGLFVIAKYCCFGNVKQGINDLFFPMMSNHCLLFFFFFTDILCTMKQRHRLRFIDILYDTETGEHRLTLTASALGYN